MISEVRQRRGRGRGIELCAEEIGGMARVMEPRVGEAEWGVLGIGEVLDRRGRCWVTGGGGG